MFYHKSIRVKFFEYCKSAYHGRNINIALVVK